MPRQFFSIRFRSVRLSCWGWARLRILNVKILHVYPSFLCLLQKKENLPKQQRWKQPNKAQHLKPSLSIDRSLQEEKFFASTSLFIRPAVVAAFLYFFACKMHLAIAFAFLKTSQKKGEASWKKTVLTTARAAGESTRRTKEEFIIVMFILLK